MKILIANKFYRPVGGPETITLDMMRELQALGHDVIPFSMAHPDNVPSDYSDYFVPNIDYNTQSGGVMSRIREAIDLVYSKEAERRISKLISDEKPDVAHSHNIYHQLSPSILKAIKDADIPSLITLHDSKLLCANMLFLTHGRVCEKCAGRWFHHAVINRCVKDSLTSSLLCCIEETLHRWTRIYEKNVDLFIAPSQFLRGKLVEYQRLPTDKIEVLPNYADTKSITPNFSPGDYGLFLGRLEPLKGVMTLLRASKESPGVKIKLAGRGPMLETGKEYLAKEGIDTVEFLGFLTGADLARAIKLSRFVTLPSECYENCPMVILEAFAAGKPVIASRMGGIPELIEEGVDGFLFEPGNAEELAKYMRRLNDDPVLAEEMGRAGRAKVEKRYSLEVYMDSLLAIYERVAGI